MKFVNPNHFGFTWEELRVEKKLMGRKTTAFLLVGIHSSKLHCPQWHSE